MRNIPLQFCKLNTTPYRIPNTSTYPRSKDHRGYISALCAEEAADDLCDYDETMYSAKKL